MQTWNEWIGRHEERHDQLTQGLIDRLRATIDSPVHDATGPQGVHFCLCTPDAATAALGHDGHPDRAAPNSLLPPVPLPRRMWASSAIHFHAPLRAGDRIVRRTTIASITGKQGGSGVLTFVELDHHTMAGDMLAVEERQTLVYRAAASGTPARPARADGAPDLSPWRWHRVLTPNEAMLFRFSAITFNSHRIHYDQPYAVNEEGYAGLVVHGPLIATLLLDLAGRELGANRLRRFAFRGQSPAFAGEPLHLVGRQEGDTITMAALGDDGRTVMSAEAAI